MDLKYALARVPVVCREGVIASRLFTLFERDTLGILIRLCREVACSR